MEFRTKIGDKTLNVNFIQSAKIKRCYLKILSQDKIEIKANRYFTVDDAKDFIQRKISWIDKHISNMKDLVLKDDEFYFLGSICLCSDFGITNRDIKEFYKQKASEIIPSIVDKYSDTMKLYPSKLKFRDNKSRWGSCSFNNTIILNTNLMKLPFSSIDYVVVHELAHIKYKNHSKEFWQFVEKFYPSYKEESKKIKYF